MQAIGHNKYGNLVENEFQTSLNNNASKGTPEIIEADRDGFIVKFTRENGTTRYYNVPIDGDVEYIEGATSAKTLTVQCVNSQDTVLGEYTYTILKDNYSKVPPTIDGYEAADQRIEGSIKENTTIKVLYYLLLQDDSTLIFTGLDSSGKVTTNESQIVSYMVGDGSNNRPNAFKDSNMKNIQSILKVPESYKGKSVEIMGKGAFAQSKSLMKINLTDNIKKIDGHAFYGCHSLKELTIPKNVIEIGHEAFFQCENLKKIIFNNKMQSYALVFHQCHLLTEIEENSDEYVVEDNILYSADKKTLIFCPTGRTGDFTIPSFVETVEKCAFNECNIQSINYGENVKFIKENAFRRVKITKLELGKNIQTVTTLAFYYCKKLEEVIIGKNINSLGHQVFMECDKLKTVIIDSVNIAKGLTTQASGHYLVNYAETIYIRNDITEIGSYVTENFNVVATDKEGYVKYVKK